MSITIKRDTGLMGTASKVQIKINGEKVASIKYNEQVDIELPEVKTRLKVTQFGVKSNEITVNEGDIIKITTTSFNRISMILMSIVIIVTNFIPNLTYKLITFTFLIILLVKRRKSQNSQTRKTHKHFKSLCSVRFPKRRGSVRESPP